MVPIARQTFREWWKGTAHDTPASEILERIRHSLRDVPGGETPEMVPVARDYRRTSDESHDHLIERFIDRLVDYKATVRRVATGGIARGHRLGLRRAGRPAAGRAGRPAGRVAALGDRGRPRPRPLPRPARRRRRRPHRLRPGGRPDGDDRPRRRRRARGGVPSRSCRIITCASSARTRSSASSPRPSPGSTASRPGR